jgi:hypothetical protein
MIISKLALYLHLVGVQYLSLPRRGFVKPLRYRQYAFYVSGQEALTPMIYGFLKYSISKGSLARPAVVDQRSYEPSK